LTIGFVLQILLRSWKLRLLWVRLVKQRSADSGQRSGIWVRFVKQHIDERVSIFAALRRDRESREVAQFDRGNLSECGAWFIVFSTPFFLFLFTFFLTKGPLYIMSEKRKIGQKFWKNISFF
jgi:hypothetical protein